MAIYLTELDKNTVDFPPTESAMVEPNGLLAFGGDLSPKRILNAYKNGIFPWYGPGEPILWWSPFPRAVFDPNTYTPSKSLKKFQRKHNYQVSINTATKQVIRYCSSVRSAKDTWLNDEMISAYSTLVDLGQCHSVEVWLEGELIGGLYGISIGEIFCGESMFSLKTNASKIALWYFCRHFAKHGGQLIDCQVMNTHLESLGAFELERSQFMQYLLSFRDKPIHSGCFDSQWLNSKA
ncbi:leucyl/phenylalanyl-tRNA--protein transferase [Vibrio marisflavi]|uniref:Leucyl/phenylalanyl-tRNA--protein transferase n=1 Tax=Vibrio marisflavi CECT 7928 TaxID=634439 RepID=A0ABN8E5F2_9VIBR|nr:leucyl/phenylalanyl-tRNA--protein transferase [Vibrio marisflavi]CAH0539424.1 Leucyl/phenylalanyl-tRNA--protein transferase [Vibrio marisflavi CECT 7928]